MKQNGMICKTLLLVAMMGFSLMSNAQRYETDHGRVYFGEEMLMQADAHSFVDLGCGYAKDRHHVYMNGRILEFVDPATFRLKEPGTWRHRDKKTDEPEVPRGYYKSKWNVYYGDKKLDLSDVVMMQKYLVKLGDITVPENADMNEDGRVNVIDLLILKDLFMQ